MSSDAQTQEIEPKIESPEYSEDEDHVSQVFFEVLFLID